MTLALTPDELLTTTRSVRRRLDLTRPVPLDLVRECLEIALQAPSGSNRQGWHWLVVTDLQTRARIGELYRRSTERYLAASDSAASPGRSGPADSDVQRRVRDSAAISASTWARFLCT
jgi:nitroreductase